MNTKNFTKITFALSYLTLVCILFFMSSNSFAASASGSRVYKLMSSNPVISLDAYRYSTITGATNKPFRVIGQNVPKVLFRKVFKKVLGVTPYGIGALAAYEAYGYFLNDNSDLVEVSLEYSTGYCSSFSMTSSLSACVSQLTSNLAGRYDPERFGTATPMPTESYPNRVSVHVNIDEAGGGYYYPDVDSSTTETLATDQQFIDAQDAYIQDFPEIDHSQSAVDEYGNPLQEMFPDPVYYENSQEDLDLVNLYESGILQDTDPNADNYVTPTEMARIKAISDELNKTAEQQAEDLTTDADKPITQAQHKQNMVDAAVAQESLLENAAGALDAVDITSLDKTGAADSGWADMTDILNTTNGLPTSNFANYFEFTSSSGCETIPLPLFGTFPSPSQCDKLGSVRTGLAYFLTIMLAWNMINIVLKEAN
jgi:hypothetical protein